MSSEITIEEKSTLEQNGTDVELSWISSVLLTEN